VAASRWGGETLGDRVYIGKLLTNETNLPYKTGGEERILGSA
jgi:hypothetical protein